MINNHSKLIKISVFIYREISIYTLWFYTNSVYEYCLNTVHHRMDWIVGMNWIYGIIYLGLGNNSETGYPTPWMEGIKPTPQP